MICPGGVRSAQEPDSTQKPLPALFDNLRLNEIPGAPFTAPIFRASINARLAKSLFVKILARIRAPGGAAGGTNSFESGFLITRQISEMSTSQKRHPVTLDGVQPTVW